MERHVWEPMNIVIERLGSSDPSEARRLFSMLAETFHEERDLLSDAYLDQLLGREDFWALAAFSGDDIVGGVTAHTLPMTRQESSEMFVFDIAVRSDHRKKGIGRLLLETLSKRASESGIRELFLAADDADEHALEFYRRLGGVFTPASMFVFSTRNWF
jgi:aminoglycoside 3-N-acetyltransferase I